MAIGGIGVDNRGLFSRDGRLAPAAAPMSADLSTQVRRRRTFAIISHPDAGKTTLTEKLLLFSGAIQIAGSVKARKATRHATSDWMEIEKQRGVESMLAERREGRRAERSALAAKRIEQRDRLVVLVDSGRRWAVNLQAVMMGSVASIPVTMETEQYKAMGRLHDEYQLQLLTAELVIDDPILKPLIGALVEHIGNLSSATQPVLDAALGGGGAQIQLDALGAYIDQANQMLNRLVIAAQEMLAGRTG